MKLEIRNNANYAAQVVQIDRIINLPNCDNVVSVPLLGYNAIVSKEIKVGDLGILFPPECQLNEEYCRVNNLFTSSDSNRDKNAKGYITSSRRVKAVKFRGNTSNALFMPLSSLSPLISDYNKLKIGDTFDTLNGNELCKKYEIITSEKGNLKNNVKGKSKCFTLLTGDMFPEHLDTKQYKRVSESIPDNTELIVTQKLHGTSIRLSHIKVFKQLRLLDKILLKLGFDINTTNHKKVVGSRRVVKTNNNGNTYYNKNIYQDVMDKYGSCIPKDTIIYGEVIGYAGTSEIQKDYTYNLSYGEFELYVYRIATITSENKLVDYSWTQIKEFCNNNGLKYVPELGIYQHSDFKPIAEKFLNVNYYKEGYTNAVPLSKKSVCDEGVCIRVEGIQPFITKYKSPAFLEKETKDLDKGIVDIESQN